MYTIEIYNPETGFSKLAKCADYADLVDFVAIQLSTAGIEKLSDIVVVEDSEEFPDDPVPPKFSQEEIMTLYHYAKEKNGQ